MADQEEFQEEDMWGLVQKDKEKKKNFTTKKKKTLSSSSAWQLPLHTTQEPMGPKARNVCENLPNIHQPSAPLQIPSWYNNTMQTSDEYFVESDDDDDEKMVPPHEYIAKKMARTKIASHSMCEGIGRTLKGRDLCKLRNAIWTQTGFLEH